MTLREMLNELPNSQAEPRFRRRSQWSVSTFWGRFDGTVLGGNIFNNGNNTFNISVALEMKSGGTGELIGEAVLNHNDFPPTVEGKLFQP